MQIRIGCPDAPQRFIDSLHGSPLEIFCGNSHTLDGTCTQPSGCPFRISNGDHILVSHGPGSPVKTQRDIGTIDRRVTIQRGVEHTGFRSHPAKSGPAEAEG